jgi:DNA-binding transcriptional ArsR family regulator
MPANPPSRRGQPRSRRTGAPEAHADAPATTARKQDAATVQLRDPRAIRALAHPARMAIIDALASGDELTATECAELTGLSPSATAYHLKLLERYRLAERAPARNDGRERPWQAADAHTSVDLDPSTPAGAAATTAVASAYLDSSRALGIEFIATERDEPEEWQNVASLANSDLWLTAEETRDVTAALAAALEPYRNRTARTRPDSSRRVRVMNMVSPHPRH